MKIAVSSKGAGLGAWIEPNLSNCGFLVIVDENFRFETIENKSGTKALIEKAIAAGVHTLVTGSVEDELLQLLQKNNIEIYYAQEGSVLELADKFIEA
jgi:predicted Fe-Mo cluster-binding NifX family protein